MRSGGTDGVAAKRHGHYCWCCDRFRANEQFSGKGHARHLCRECATLGQAEIAYRQAVRAIDRLADPFRGIVPLRHRKAFERFLSHPNERVSAYASRVAKQDEDARCAYRLEREAEENDFDEQV
jgi:hypothetical protein